MKKDLTQNGEKSLYNQVLWSEELYRKRHGYGFFALLDSNFDYTREQIEYLIKELNNVSTST